MIHYRVGERREAIQRQVIDPSLLQNWEIATALEEQSTIFHQTLGEPLGANAPYSMVALLSQAGRLPLLIVKRKAGWCMGEAMEIALQWIRKEGRQATAYYQGTSATLSVSDIPSRVDVLVDLGIDLPQDQLNAANAANVMAQGE